VASPPRRRFRCALRAHPPDPARERGRSRSARGLALALTLTTVVWAALTPAGGAWAHPGLETAIQDDVTFQDRPPDQVLQAIDQVRALGIDRVRLTASWSTLAPDPESLSRPPFDASDPAAYDQSQWRELDFAVRAAQAAGLKMMIDIGAWAPRWAAGGPGPRARDEIDASAFGQFAQAVARRYSGSFVPPGQTGGDVPLPRVDMFTLWNEPNHPAFLLPQWSVRASHRVPASPAEYRHMVDQAYGAMKAVQPSSTVLVGNTSSFGGRGPNDPVAPLEFLRALACVNARLRPLRTPDCRAFHRVPGDGWAHHPYSLTGTPAKTAEPGHPDDIYMGNLSRLARTLDRLVAMRRLAPGMRSIYITEYGYETHALLDRPALPQNKQALYLTWGEYLASRIPNVRLFSQFLLRDQPPAPTVVSDSPRRPNGQFYSGLEEANGTPKLAVHSFVAGLFATRATRGTTLLWGRLRLGPRTYEVVIDHRSHHGPWRLVPTSSRPGRRPVRSFELAGQDSFTRYGARGRGQYRLRYRPLGGTWTMGLPIPFVARAR